MRHVTHVLALTGVLLGLASPAAGQPVEPTLAAAGEAAAEMPRLHSLLVSWRGEIVLERYFNGRSATRLANVKSVSKSVISALVGIAIDRQALNGVRQPIGPFFPEIAAADHARRAITVEDLLTMRAGLEGTSNRNYGAWVQSSNWVRYALGRPLLDRPGVRMEYSTGSTHLLSALLTRATRQSTWAFAQEALAQPLGFRLAQWLRDPQGIYFGGNEMQMTPRQMVTFGELYLNEGRVGGRQVVPQAWVRDSLRVRTRSRFNDQGYGYGWWSRDFAGYETWFAWGYGGQYVFVVPGLDLVVVTTSNPNVSEERRAHRRTIFNLLEDLIIPAVVHAES